MYSSLLLICLALPAQSEPGAPTGAAEGDLRAEVRRLAAQLDDNLLVRRQEAEAALIQLGPEVLGHLPRITSRTPAEVKERLGRVRKALETAVAAATAKPSLVTLKGEMPLADALRALEEQTGNKIANAERRGGSVSADFENVPYWQALDQLLDQASMTIEPFGGQPNALVLKARAEGELDRAANAIYAGVFRFEPIRLEMRRDLRNPAINGLRITLSVTWEPRIKPISLRQSLDNLSAVDDRGEELTIDNSRGALNASAESGVSAVELVLPIALPERDARRIASVKGTLAALVPGSVETFEFTDLATARDVEQQNAGVAVTLERVRQNGNVQELRMRVRYDEAANALESHRGWVFNNEAYIVDAQGERVDNLGLNATRQEPNEAGVAYQFVVPDGLKDCKFVYKTPALILDLPVEFELRDIPLP